MRIGRFFIVRKRKLPIGNRTNLNQNKPSNSNVLSQLLFVLIGGFVGAYANQFYFAENRKFEASIQLKKEFISEQLPAYNRLINFAYDSRGTTILNKELKKIITTSYDPFGLIYMRDTTAMVDTVKYIFPSFVVQETNRNEFLNDIDDIKKEKYKLDQDVWQEFTQVLMFLNNNPLPSVTNFNEQIKSNWDDTITHKDWNKITVNLYKVVIEKRNKLYEL